MITENQTVGEIAAISLGAVRVFEKSGIDYCCGGKQSLGAVCREQGLDSASLIEELRSVTAEKATPEKDWTSESLRELIRHIVGTHHEFLKLELPRLGERLEKVLKAHGDKDPERLGELSDVYRGLWSELDHHMHKEEMMLFPAIERFEAAVTSGQPAPPLPFGTFENPVMVMEREHDNAGNALTRIRALTNGRQLPEYACATYRALYEGFEELETDLHLHIHLENNILFPRAVKLEKARS